jgi:hypothetical protein
VLDSLEEAKDAVALVLAEPGYELPPPGTAAPPPAVRCSVLHKKNYCHLIRKLFLSYIHFKRIYEYEICHLYKNYRFHKHVPNSVRLEDLIL